MIEEILPNLYKMEIPLPRSPLKALNSYLIKEPERSLIIDTGMNREECMREMQSCLSTLNVDLKRTDFFITHLHSDHIGLVGDLVSDTSKVYFNAKETYLAYPDDGHWQRISENFRLHGFPEDELRRAMERHPGRVYGPRHAISFCLLQEGDALDAGDYSFRCIETPGHTPGHICLYEADKKILVAGDHILSNITPNITTWPGVKDSLGQYLASLDKVLKLDVDLLLPGHRRILHDHRQRIAELKQHHKARLQEVITALEDGEKTAFQVAPWVKWDIQHKSWELFPPVQKIFAVGETLAHLEHLEEQGVARRRTEKGRVLFSLS